MKFWSKVEFNRILSLISDECHSILGKENTKKLHPLKDSRKVIFYLKLIAEIQQMQKRGLSYSFENVERLHSFLENREHQILSFEEFRLVAMVVRRGNELFLDVDDEKFEDFSKFVELRNRITQFDEIDKRFKQIFTFDGEILDSASNKLLSIRKKQKSLRIKIQKTLKAKLEDKTIKNFLSDEIITQRNDRYVIPIKESSVPFVDGISHGSSASRSTVYIEPKEVVSINNEIDLNTSEEKQEIYSILKDFTNQIYAENKALISNAEKLGLLDSQFAIARFSNRIKSNSPKIIEEPKLSFVEARHPLLIETYGNEKDVIPFDLKLGDKYNMLVISGPNTGGKTVTLKSVGLLTIMALSGIPIPANEDTEIGMFHSFYADIGDDQSLEDALSTFSSHIKTMKEMLEKGNNKTLILIDEIGSSTDPEQGSALAQVFLEDLVEKEITGIVTTHFTPLKVFAENSNICMNAAMEFDPQKHIPTYKLKLGIPGNSFALEIASKLGLSQDLISRARKKVGQQTIDLSDLLTKLETQKIEYAKEAYQKKLKAKLLERKSEEYEKRKNDFDAETKKMKKNALRETRDYLSSLQKELQKEISDIKKLDIKNKKKKTEELLNSVVNKNQHFKKKENILTNSNKKLIENPKIGDSVWVEDLDSEGNIVEISNNQIKIDLDGFYFT
ncbi:MAG: hypothetical protein U9N34_01980, partial [Candidatus Cloacimonadota bacterium]|nr:hypothetical protein [Candidatus Cloacimonadota bacterium]